MSDIPAEIHPLKIADFRFYWMAVHGSARNDGYGRRYWLSGL